MTGPQSELVLLGPAAFEPVDREAAKTWVRAELSQSEDDASFDMLITAAREHAEAFCRRKFQGGQQWQLNLNSFPLAVCREDHWYSQPFTERYESEGIYQLDVGAAAITVPPEGWASPGKVLSITSLKYIDPAGALQTMDPASYSFEATSLGGYVFPAYQTGWPATHVYPRAIQVQFTAGQLVSPRVKLYILQTVAHWYANRESIVMESGVIPQDVLMNGEKLLWPFRNLEF